MMRGGRRKSKAALRFEERQRRDKDAPRLHHEHPELRTLRLELAEYRQGESATSRRHIRHIVVERAAALFIFPCSTPDCDGEHDFTHELSHKLRVKAEQFEGKRECRGLRHGIPCDHGMSYQAYASYTGR